jgi:type I restriction enzyme M protein
MLTNVDEQGRTFEAHLPLKEDKFGEMKRVSSIELVPIKITQGDIELNEFGITKYDTTQYTSLDNYCADAIKPLVAQFDYKEQPLLITTADANYFFDAEQETLIKEADGIKEALGCGKIVVSASYKKATKKLAERIEISVELTADYQKDYEIIPFHKDPSANQAAIEAFMARYISNPFVYLENVVGVELNFNKIFYKPETLHPVSEIAAEIAELDKALKKLEAELAL